MGTRDAFDYVECGACGTLQIERIPADLARYYEGGYYAFEKPYVTPWPKRWLKRRLARHLLGHVDPVGRLVAALWREPREVDWVRRAGLGLDAAILDVGAGSGQVLVTMRDYGFRRLTGVDAFLDADREHAGGVVVRRGTLEDVEGRYDLVMLHHSLEHVPDPRATLAAAARRLTAAGRILVRMPVTGASWEEYGVDWVELDAPRHLHVFSRPAFEALAGELGLAVRETVYDTTSFELWGSELYRRDIPLSALDGAAGLEHIFSAPELAALEARAEALNRSGRAGRAAFWLARQEPPSTDSLSHSANRGIPTSTGVEGS